MRTWRAVLACLLIAVLSAPAAARGDNAAPAEGQPRTGDRGRTETNGTIMARPDVPTTSPQQTARPRLRPTPRSSGAGSTAGNAAQPAGDGRVPSVNAPQTVGGSFLGAQFIDDSDFVPPDSMGAVGPTQFLLGINGRIRTFTKSGTADGILDSTLNNFFASVGGLTNNIVDPRVRYDRFSGKWFVTAMDIPDGENHILIAVSSGSDITASSTWAFFTIAAPADWSFDFPTLGIDEDALYIGVNLFQLVEPFDLNTDAYVVRKSSVLGAGPIVFTPFTNLVNPTTFAGLWSPMGVDNADTGTNEGYFIGVDFAQFDRLVVRRITDPGGTPSISSNLNITVPATEFPAPVPQPGSAPLLDGLDDRLSNAVIRGGRLWTAHNFEVNASGNAAFGGGRDGVRWYEIENLSTTPSRRQSGTIFDSASVPFNYWMPSVMVSGQGHVAFGFSRAGENATTGFASVATAGRLATAALGTTGAPMLIQGSTFSYETGISDPERWGDYSYTSLDPNDDMTMWTVQEYTSATNKWGVRVVQLKAPPPTVSSGGSAPPDAASTPVTVTGTGFFEPGVSFPNHLTASVSGGPIVSGVTSVTPTQIVLDVSTVGVAEGSYPLTITNPDGQSTSGTLTVSTAPLLAHDLAVIKLSAVKRFALGAIPVTKTVKVSIQNRSPHSETIPDRTTLSNLIQLNVDSLNEGECPDASVVLAEKQKTLPLTLKSKSKFTANFDVTFNCIVDPARTNKDDPGHDDFTMSASVHHEALDGTADTHAEDDICPRSVTPPYEIDPNPDGTIKDKGCGAKKTDKTYGDPLLVDVYAP